MKKFLLSLIALAMLCATNAWAADAETSEYKWVESTKTLTIKASGYANGVMSDYTTGNQPWSSYKSSVQHIIVQDGIKTIGTYAFYNCSSTADIILPASLQCVKQGAFGLCTSLGEVRFKGSPNEWASIDFQSSDEFRRSQPFYANVNKAGGTPGTANRKFAFYYTSGSAPSSVNLEFTSAISEIKPYAFYGATNIVDVYIPGTVSTIGDYALYCAITNLYVNKKKAPNKGTSSITWKTSGTYLYVPEGATTSYKAQPFYNASSGTSTGAKNIGTSGDHNNFKASGIGGTGNTYKTSGFFDNIEWSLDSVGTLKLEGYGSVSTNYSGSSYSNDTNLPWGRFRRLVNKAIIKANGGDITTLYSVLRYHYALDTIIFEQNTIPTHTSLIAGTSSNFDALFDQRKNVTLKIKAASLADASVSNLGSAPWNNAKLDIGLSDNVVFADNVDNSALVSNLNTYVEKPFTLQLGRSMSNTDEYYTFCSPIDLSASQVATIFGAEAKLHTMTGSSYDEGTNELSLNFDDCSTIVAGKPYIVMPSQAVSNPTIENVDPSAVTATADKIEATNVTFYGTLAPRAVDEDEIAGGKMIILIGNSELTWANGGTVGGMRAYWLLDQSAPTGVRKAKPVMRIGKTATAIEEVRSENANAVRSEKVLRDGQIYILRDNKMYNMQGQLVK